MTGIIDVGGGLRGVYGAGVFDGLLDLDIHIECCIGVSAGSANLCSYIAEQRGRNYRFFRDYTFRKEYMGFGNMLRSGSFINFDYIYGTLSNSDGEDPVDYEKFSGYKGIFKVVATDALTGKPVFFDKSDVLPDDFRVFSASCCIPVVNKPVTVNGKEYFDGGVALPLPLDYAMQTLGCDKVIVVLTLPKDVEKPAGIDANGGAFLPRYPVIGQLLKTRAERYNRQVKKALELEKEGKVLIIAPDDTCGIDTLTRDVKGIELLYEKGVNDARAALDFIGR